MFRLIFMVVVLILVLSFFNISLRSIVFSQAGQQNFEFLWQLIVTGWNYGVSAIVHSVESLAHAA